MDTSQWKVKQDGIKFMGFIQLTMPSGWNVTIWKEKEQWVLQAALWAATLQNSIFANTVICNLWINNLKCFKNDKCLGLLLLVLFIECFLYARHLMKHFLFVINLLKNHCWKKKNHCCCCSVAVSDSLWPPHGLQHARPPCPSVSPGIRPSPCSLNRWCHPTISSSVAPFSSCNLSQHQGLFQWDSSSPQVAKVLERHKNHVGRLLASVFTQRCWETLLNWAEVSQPAVKSLFLC